MSVDIDVVWCVVFASKPAPARVVALRGEDFFRAKENAPNKSGRLLEVLRLFERGRLALQRSWQVRLDRRQYCLEALGVAGDDVAFLKEVVTAGEVAHQAAGFLDQ